MFFLEEKVRISKNYLRLFPLIRHGFAVPPSPQGKALVQCVLDEFTHIY